MGHRVRVNTGKTGVMLPDGNVYDGQVIVTLSDEEYADIHPTAFSSGTLTDLGELPGVSGEIAYAERTTNDTTSNTATDNATLQANLIGGLAITVVGAGKPVRVDYQVRVRHSVASTALSTILMVNGVADGAMSYWATASSPQNNNARSVFTSRRLLLSDGVSYTFELAKQISAAGTGTWEGALYWPMWISVVEL